MNNAAFTVFYSEPLPAGRRTFFYLSLLLLQAIGAVAVCPLVALLPTKTLTG